MESKLLKPKQKTKSKRIKFQFQAPTAKTVYLAGSFNNWDYSVYPLKQSHNGEWGIAIDLAPGRYEYRFVVDDNWECDQNSVECVPNTFGSWNSIIEIAG